MPAFIETVSTARYRFICPVQLEDESSGTPVTTDAGMGSNGTEDVLSSASPVADTATQTKVSGTKGLLWAMAGVAAIFLALIAVAIWYLRRPLPPPRVTEYIKITNDGERKILVGTDGSRLYMNLMNPPRIVQVAISGGQTVPVAVPLPSPVLYDVSAASSRLLVSSFDAQKNSFWSIEAPGGSPAGLLNTQLGASWSRMSVLAHPTRYAADNSTVVIINRMTGRVNDIDRTHITLKRADYVVGIARLFLATVYEVPGWITLGLNLANIPDCHQFCVNAELVGGPILNGPNPHPLPDRSIRPPKKKP